MITKRGALDFSEESLVIPDDCVYASYEVANKLISLYSTLPEEMMTEGDVYLPEVPTDLMYARTIPLPDFTLKWFTNGAVEQTFIINTFEDGVTIKHDRFWVSFVLVDNKDGLGVKWKLWRDGSRPELTKRDVGVAQTIHSIWYGVQLLLLNPRTETLFHSGHKEKQYTRSGSGKARKRIVKYVKKHYITPECIDEALGCSGTYSRKTMAWYVIGHWRRYKNGNIKFIQGYWKGPLRETKRSFDGGRIRQLDA